MKRTHIDSALPPTPMSFHLALEDALRKTEDMDMNKANRTRITRTALIAAIIGVLLIGTALAITARIGMWDFLKSDDSINLPATNMPEIDEPNASLQGEGYTLSVTGAYYENDIVNLLITLERETPFAQNEDMMWYPHVTITYDETGEQPVYYDPSNAEWRDGVIYYYMICPLPDDSPDTVTVQVYGEITRAGNIVLPLTRKTTDNTRNARLDNADRVISGAGITIDAVSANSSSLGVTLTLKYTFDINAVTAPELPSCYIDFFTSGDGVYHRTNCPLYTQEMRACAYSEIVAGDVRPCDIDECRFLPKDFSETYMPLIDSVCFELVDENDLRLEVSQGSDYDTETEDGGLITTFILNMPSIPEIVKLRAFDVYEKGRWADTVTIRLDAENGASFVD